MTAIASDCVYALSSHIRWVQDIDRIIVADDLNRRGYELHGVEAAIWSWLPLAFPYAKLVRLLTGLFGVPTPQAAARLRETLEDWQAQGLLVASTDGSHG